MHACALVRLVQVTPRQVEDIRQQLSTLSGAHLTGPKDNPRGGGGGGNNKKSSACSIM